MRTWPQHDAFHACAAHSKVVLTDERWAVSGRGHVVRIGGFAGVKHDLGVFDGRAPD